jgi:UDP-N-acetylglucosamine 3-dehydrogenase
VRVAVIGLGIGRTHVDRYAGLPGVELAAVCDLDRATAEAIAGERGCRAFADPERMLDEVAPDAVSICTPPSAHPELTEAAACRGVHVLVEKPMASTVEGCDRMIASARRHDVVLMLGHKKRFAPPFVRLRDLTASDGPLGPIRQVTLKYQHPGMSPRDWFWSEEDGGGPILENHVHAADTLGYLVGAPTRVYAEGATRFVAGREPQPNLAAYTARFAGREPGDGDVLVAVGYGMIGPLPSRPLCDETWFFGCERGAAEVSGPFDNLQSLRWAVRGRGQGSVEEESWPEADPFLGEIEHFLACLPERREPRASGAAGRQAVRFCLAVKESIARGAVVTL